MKRLLNFINGEYAEPIRGKYFDNYNPSTGKPYSQIPDSDELDIEHAVDVAKAAFKTWSQFTAKDRADILYKIADLIDSKKVELAEAESMDQGKPVTLALKGDLARASLNFRFFAGDLLHAKDQAIHTDQNTFNYTRRKPIGVAGLISPWNLPLYLLTWKIAPALAAGNTVVCKPSEMTSMTAFMFGEILNQAGLPKGVCNIVLGTGKKAGSALTEHPDVPVISFTGGTETGKAIASVAAPQFKKLSLELGGKNPNIIFDDANLAECIKMTLRSSFLNQGEICLCGSRIFVQEKIYDQFLSEFKAQAAELVVGDPRDEKTFMGPLVSKEHLEKVVSYIELAKKEGGEIILGGTKPTFTGELAGGYFLNPTIITGLDSKCRVMQEEIFGPVVTVTKFKDEAEVIELANGVRYGLSASIWTQNLDRAHRVAEKVDAGIIWINSWMLRDLRIPFGGMKASGMGREGGEHSLEFFTETKNVCVKY